MGGDAAKAVNSEVVGTIFEGLQLIHDLDIPGAAELLRDLNTFSKDLAKQIALNDFVRIMQNDGKVDLVAAASCISTVGKGGEIMEDSYVQLLLDGFLCKLLRELLQQAGCLLSH